jgi:hypothetical protein
MKFIQRKFSEWEQKDPVVFAILLVGVCEAALCLMIYTIVGA